MVEFDSPWKEALDDFLQPFLQLHFPRVEDRIDWSYPPESLDNELAKLFPDGVGGKGVVDRLYKVRAIDGALVWLLLHVEVQSQRVAEFPERVFRYFYRLLDKFELPLTCLVVLADESPSWRPDSYTYEFAGTRLQFTYPIAKLADYSNRIEELERSDNLFALIVLAHLQSQRVREDENRLEWKRRITRNLLERPIDEERRSKVLRLVDWLIDLPVELNGIYWNEVREWRERNTMPFVSGLERIAEEAGRQKGRQEGRQEGKEEGLLTGLGLALEVKFQESGIAFFNEIKERVDLKKLEAIYRAVRNAANVEELRKLL